jgi:hypothetical protein
MGDSLRNPLVFIFATPGRNADASTLAGVFERGGARVNLVQVPADRSTQTNRGSIYYFRNDPKYLHVANTISLRFSSIERFRPMYLSGHSEDLPDFSIWLVSEVALQSSRKTTVPLTTCPKCPSPVRIDRLDKHLKTKHPTHPKKSEEKRVVTRKRRKKKRKARDARPIEIGKVHYFGEDSESIGIVFSLLDQFDKGRQPNSSASSVRRRTPHVPAAGTPLQHRRPKRTCRQCPRKPMYGEDVCYEHIK